MPRNVQATVWVVRIAGGKNEPDLFLLWNCDCEGRFSICAYLQCIYMQMCGQILECHGAFSLDAVISPGMHCLWPLGSAGAATLESVNCVLGVSLISLPRHL